MDSVVGSGIGGKDSSRVAPNDDVGLNGLSPENPVVCGCKGDGENEVVVAGGEPADRVNPAKPLDVAAVPVVCEENVDVDVCCEKSEGAVEAVGLPSEDVPDALDVDGLPNANVEAMLDMCEDPGVSCVLLELLIPCPKLGTPVGLPSKGACCICCCPLCC